MTKSEGRKRKVGGVQDLLLYGRQGPHTSVQSPLVIQYEVQGAVHLMFPKYCASMHAHQTDKHTSTLGKPTHSSKKGTSFP